MKISIIIPTLDRQHDLQNTLQSILRNTMLPDEILVIEQGNETKTKQALQKIPNTFPVQVHSFSVKSLTQARNFGITNSAGDIVFFFDDDVEIDKHYIESAHNYLLSNPLVMGVNGNDVLSPVKDSNIVNYLSRLLGTIFFASSFSSRNVVLRSGQNVLRNNSKEKQHIEWMSGCNMVIRKKIFDEGLSFNKNFMRWSFGEDVMLSYQIFKKYGPGALVYLPQLKLKHFQSAENRMGNSQKVRMQIIYRYIFWSREVSQNVFDIPAFLLSQFFFSVLVIIQTKDIKTLAGAYFFLVKHRKEIKSDTVDYNSFIFS